MIREADTGTEENEEEKTEKAKRRSRSTQIRLEKKRGERRTELNR